MSASVPYNPFHGPRLALAVIALCLLAALARGADPYPYPNHVHTMMSVRAYYEADGKEAYPASLSFSTMGQVEGKTSYTATVINLKTTPLHLNGVKYDPENAMTFADPYSDEIGRWWAFTGYFAITPRKGGGYNFDSIAGKEEKALFEYGMKWVRDPVQKGVYQKNYERGHSGCTTVRVKTMAECRDLWKKEWTGEIKFDIAKQTYVDVPVGQRVPLGPIPKTDPRRLPLITPDI